MKTGPVLYFGPEIFIGFYRNGSGGLNFMFNGILLNLDQDTIKKMKVSFEEYEAKVKMLDIKIDKKRIGLLKSNADYMISKN